MDVSIIIVNYNTVKYTLDAIDSVFDKTKGIAYEIIVVDNNSSDNSKEIIAQKYGGKVTYLALPENIGFGRANNEGAKIAKGRNLFLLNPDTILLNNAVKILSGYLDSNPRVGCCGGNLYSEKLEPATSFSRIFPSVLEELDSFLFGIIGKIMFQKNRNYNYGSHSLKVAWVLGADIMIKKALFDALNGFDPVFFLFHEEIELEYRLHKLKYEIHNVPCAHIMHLEGKSISDNLKKQRMKYASRSLWLKKHRKSSILLVNIIAYATAIMRIYIWTILGNKEKIDLWVFAFKHITPPPPRTRRWGKREKRRYRYTIKNHSRLRIRTSEAA
jgi:GT2 family glycosyltransferase